MITATEPAAALVPANSESPATPARAGTGLPATIAALVPTRQLGELMSLPSAERERVLFLLGVMQSLDAKGRGITKALRAAALQHRNREGCSYQNLRTLYYAWKDMGRDWRALKRRYHRESSLPTAFVDFIRAMVLREHNSAKQALNRATELWRKGDPVPGYGTWREWFADTYPGRDIPKQCPELPTGWSNSNLYTRLPSRVYRALATKGRAAAEKMLPHVVRDPSSLRFLELITIDDFETDVMAVFGKKVVRVRGVLALDVATRTTLGVIFKPVIEGDEGQKIAITRADVQFLICNVLDTHGLPGAYPMTILCENAAAAIPSALEATFSMLFGGQIRVVRTPMLNFKTAANGFIERGGRPNIKGWIESDFHLAWNRAGNLRGQKGSRYDNKPGDLAPKLKYFAQLAAYETTDAQWAEFRHPFEQLDDLITAFGEVFRWMDNRTEHKLLGFDQVRTWRRGPGDEPKPIETLALLAPEEQAGVVISTRMESPVERREKLKPMAQLTPIPKHLIAYLAFTPKKVKIENHAVTFKVAGETHPRSYVETGDCKLRTRHGGRVENKTELLAYYDPAAPLRLYCYTLDNAYLGELEWINPPVDIKDAAATSEAAVKIARWFEAEVAGPVKHALAGDRAEAEADRAHNAALIKREGLMTPAERKKQSLSRTLADDNYTVPAAERFAAGHAAARAIGASAHCAQESIALNKRLRARATRISDEDRAGFLDMGTQASPPALQPAGETPALPCHPAPADCLENYL